MRRIGQGYSSEIIKFPSASASVFDFSTPLQKQLQDTFLDVEVCTPTARYNGPLVVKHDIDLTRQVNKTSAQLRVSYAFTRMGPANYKDLVYPELGHPEGP